MIRRCRVCRRWRRRALFVWRDASGQSGLSPRCYACRNIGKRAAIAACPGCQAIPGKGRCIEHCNPWHAVPARFWIRHHAIERYQERVRPDLTMTKARDEMIRLMESAPFSEDGPRWLGHHPAGRKRYHVGYLLIADDLVFAISSYGYAGNVFSRRGLYRVSTVLTPRLDACGGSS